MRVLLLCAMADGQTGPAIKYAFEKLGHIVRAVDAKTQPMFSLIAAYEFRPDLIFCSKSAVLADQIPKIKNKFKNAITCMWQIDTRPTTEHWRYLFPLIEACDYHFVVSSRLIPEWRKINPNTFWLPQGVQDEIYKKPKGINSEDRQRYSCDVSWAGHIGNLHEFRIKFLFAVMSMDVVFKKWGCLGSPVVYNEEHNKMVALSKINLAMSRWIGNEKYSSVRNYKILGAGGFLLELNRKSTYGLFPENIMDCCASMGEFTEKIHYWLNNEKERKEIAERGYKWVHENATYAHRIQTALEYMGLAGGELSAAVTT